KVQRARRRRLDQLEHRHLPRPAPPYAVHGWRATSPAPPTPRHEQMPGQEPFRGMARMSALTFFGYCSK
ncbi:MAG TPA: hypothetical protein VEL02_02920, partial [Jatrophihabitantaceae bacterium]|nr:hypothetical protein [Jatrophihabitantaceae bacterium]